jgi:hypothetical protein
MLARMNIMFSLALGLVGLYLVTHENRKIPVFSDTSSNPINSSALWLLWIWIDHDFWIN